MPTLLAKLVPIMAMCCVIAMRVLLFAGISDASAQIMEAPPQALEERLPRAGGVRTRRGTVLDEVQIACAKVTCQKDNCSWTSYYTAGTAGSPAGGNLAAWMM
jgi:hypothetical protein